MEHLTDDDLRFDRLVDGEMSDTERRHFLASLDDEPGGWRRCAMAFLEDQAWRESMPDVALHAGMARVESSSSAPVQQGTKVELPVTLSDDSRDRNASGWGRSLAFFMAMAACCLLAFFLGSQFRMRSTPDGNRSAPLAGSLTGMNDEVAVEASPIETGRVKISPDEMGSDEMGSGEMGSDATPRDMHEHRSPDDLVPWGEATFVVDDDAGHEVEVPVFDLDQEAQLALLENSTAALDDLRSQLQRRGFDVQRTVQWSPVEMGDGQQMYVPVGDFEITGVSHRIMPQ